jgi:hypothetical protein
MTMITVTHIMVSILMALEHVKEVTQILTGYMSTVRLTTDVLKFSSYLSKREIINHRSSIIFDTQTGLMGFHPDYFSLGP